MVKAQITTVLDTLGLLLISGGSGWLLKVFIPGEAGWAAGVILMGMVILAGSWLSDFMTTEEKG